MSAELDNDVPTKKTSINDYFAIQYLSFLIFEFTFQMRNTDDQGG